MYLSDFIFNTSLKLGFEEISRYIRSNKDQDIQRQVDLILCRPINFISAQKLRLVALALIKSSRLSLSRVILKELINSEFQTTDDLIMMSHNEVAYRGLSLVNQPRSSALPILQQLTELCPENSDAWLNLIQVWLDQPSSSIDFHELQYAIDEALLICPNDLNIRYYDAMVAQHLGNITSAISKYEYILSIKPNHSASRFRLWLLNPACETNIIPNELSAVESWQLNDLVCPKTFTKKSKYNYLNNGGTIIKGGFGKAINEQFCEEITRYLQRQFELTKLSSFDFSTLPKNLQYDLEGMLDSANLCDGILQTLSKYGNQEWACHKHKKWHLQYHTSTESKPTSLHQDYPTYSDNADWFTLWMPLVNCGPSITPALFLSTCNFGFPIHFEEQFGDHINPVPRNKACNYFRETMVEPTFETGDILIFNKYFLHSSVPGKNKLPPRISIDVRYYLGPVINGFIS